MKRVLPLFLMLIFFGFLTVQAAEEEMPVYPADLTTMAVQQIPLAEMMGPIAPVAASPFFGLTMISGGSIAARAGVPVLNHNDYLKKNKSLGNWYVFGLLLLLTVATSLPRFTKVSNSIGTVLGFIEDKSSIVVFVIVTGITLAGLSAGGQENVAVVQAGFLDIPIHLFMLAVMALNMFVVMTVRFFIDVLVFISPIPFVDGLLEISKKGFAFGMMTLYMFSPTLAFIVNIIIFLIAFLMFRKASRISNFFKWMLVRPFVQKIFKWETDLVSKKVPGSLRDGLSGLKMALPVFPMSAEKGFPRKAISALMLHDRGLSLLRRRIFRKDLRMELPTDIRPECGIADLFIRIRWRDAEGKVLHSLSLSREFLEHYPALLSHLGAEDLGDLTVAGKMKKGLKNLAGAFKSGKIAKEDLA